MVDLVLTPPTFPDELGPQASGSTGEAPALDVAPQFLGFVIGQFGHGSSLAKDSVSYA